MKKIQEKKDQKNDRSYLKVSFWIIAVLVYIMAIIALIKIVRYIFSV
ncbi:hypothetical protein L6278_02180 [Candidatus Parcubacteria bacterium]|nr:hypothetical protein [Patescibacteria group bacterium]MCG2686926.1 hypothetical protein [Candidatus Parcubacteria bacterium]